VGTDRAAETTGLAAWIDGVLLCIDENQTATAIATTTLASQILGSTPEVFVCAFLEMVLFFRISLQKVPNSTD